MAACGHGIMSTKWTLYRVFRAASKSELSNARKYAWKAKPWGNRLMPISTHQKRNSDTPQKCVPYGTCMFCGVSPFPKVLIIFERKKETVLPILTTLQLSCVFLLFSLEFLECIAEKTMVFIDVPANGIQHEFFIYLSRRTMMEAAEVIVFLDISKMSFCLNGADLTIQDSFFTLDVGI